MLYFSDNFNFKKENFPALYGYLDRYHREYAYDDTYADAKKFNLDVPGIHDDISFDLWMNEKYEGIRLYDVYEHQLFFHCSSSKIWKSLKINNSKDDYFSILFDNFYVEIMNCRKAAKFWINHWLKKVNSLKIDAGISFGGSLIYSNAFAKVLLNYGIPHYCVEHFFTGNEWYLEKRYEPIPNNSILQNKFYCENLMKEKFMDREKTFYKLDRTANKNVKQPEYKNLQKNRYCLILGQVSNDFSLASTNNMFKNSAEFYVHIVKNLLEKSDMDIVIKTHPYEKYKLKESNLTTYNFLKHEIQTLPGGPRVTLVDDFSLYGLIDGSTFVVTLNSQAGLQALQRFKPVVCFGGAFYGKKGFTYDYKNVEDFLAHRENIRLTMNMYEEYLKFMDVAFEHLVGRGEESKVAEQLHEVLKKCIKYNNLPKFVKGAPHPSTQVATKKRFPMTSFQRKMRKLLHSPRRFFQDSWLLRAKLH